MLGLPLLAVLIQTLAGAPVDALQAPAGTRAIVFLFTSTDCPISNRFAPEVHRLATEFGSRGVLFRLIYPNPADDSAAIRAHLKSFGYAGATEAFRDPTHALVALVKATITPEAAVLAAGQLVYHGRINDRYIDLGVERASPTTHDLEDALSAVLAGKPIAHPATQAVGCYIADFK
jgi:hypothetical protein